MADEGDRKTRFLAGSFGSAIGEVANDGLERARAPLG